jgi:hypothetical protein
VNDNISLEIISSDRDYFIVANCSSDDAVYFNHIDNSIEFWNQGCQNVDHSPKIKWYVSANDLRLISRSYGSINCNYLTNNIYFSSFDYSAKIFLDVNNDWVVFDTNSSTNLFISGETSSLRLSTAFSDGILNAEDLRSSKVEVLHKGYNDVIVNVNDHLIVDIETAGRVLYKGDPTIIESNVSNGGELIKL